MNNFDLLQTSWISGDFKFLSILATSSISIKEYIRFTYEIASHSKYFIKLDNSFFVNFFIARMNCMRRKWRLFIYKIYFYLYQCFLSTKYIYRIRTFRHLDTIIAELHEGWKLLFIQINWFVSRNIQIFLPYVVNKNNVPLVHYSILRPELKRMKLFFDVVQEE